MAQAPNAFSYQSVIRSSSSALVSNKSVSVQLSILQGSSGGTAVYIETHNPTTNAQGLVSIMVGDGTSAQNFSSIDWSKGPYFIKTETDPEGGTDYTISGTSQLLSVPYALYASNIPVNPYEVFVKEGATGGDGSQAKPFATIADGLSAVAANGTIHVLDGTYPVTASITINKAGVTLKGRSAAKIVLQSAAIAFVIKGSGVTLDGLTITSDNSYAVAFIQIGGTNHRLSNCTVYGPQQSGGNNTWVVNRGFVTESAAKDLTVEGCVFHTLRQPAYLNPSSTGHIINNVVYNSRGFVVDKAAFIFSGNSWGPVENASDIAILDGTPYSFPYNDLSHLSRSNNAAIIDDQRGRY
jgi:hypothetical protein